MNFIKKVGDFFAGAGGNVIETVANTVDRFITNPDEKAKIKEALLRLDEEQRQNQRRFVTDMEQMVQQRESEIELTIRAELEAQKSIIIKELEQGDTYTKRARPTVVYAGLIFIALELLGLRHIILNALDLGPQAKDIIASSDSVFKYFLTAWAGVVGVYSVGRSMEKRGTRNAWTAGMTGSNSNSTTDITDKAIVQEVKNKLRDTIKW